jgi:hypothetical protein
MIRLSEQVEQSREDEDSCLWLADKSASSVTHGMELASDYSSRDQSRQLHLNGLVTRPSRHCDADSGGCEVKLLHIIISMASKQYQALSRDL